MGVQTRRWLILLSSSSLWIIRPALGNERTWTGYVTDTHCGTHCQLTSEMKPDLHCIRLCVKKGSKYGLWSGSRVYVLEPQREATKFAAKEVQVSGTLLSDTIQIKSISPAPDLGDK